MASLMDELISTLENENGEYEKLIAYSREKTNYIIAANIDELQNITEMEQLVVEEINKLEKKRVEVLGDIAVVLNKDSSALKLTNLVNMLAKQPKEQKRLAQIRDKLKSTTDNMKIINEQNKLLLQQSLQMLEFDLNLFKSLKQGPETANYDKTAYNVGDIMGTQIKRFDAKQ